MPDRPIPGEAKVQARTASGMRVALMPARVAKQGGTSDRNQALPSFDWKLTCWPFGAVSM